MGSRKSVIKQTLRFGLGILVGVVIMVLVYLAIGKLSAKVFVGAAAGTVISVGNFFFMCVSLTNATESEIDATKAVAKARGGYMLRMLAIAALLIIAIKSGYCDVIATIVPLLLMRPVLMLEEFFVKNGDKK
ncbi:MAG: hypothetical protein E7675_02820 [Ruminococcaceae bacterium]|nr:hypothetical protein [Oscillospiraceae bacterium]